MSKVGDIILYTALDGVEYPAIVSTAAEVGGTVGVVVFSASPFHVANYSVPDDVVTLSGPSASAPGYEFPQEDDTEPSLPVGPIEGTTGDVPAPTV